MALGDHGGQCGSSNQVCGQPSMSGGAAQVGEQRPAACLRRAASKAATAVCEQPPTSRASRLAAQPLGDQAARPLPLSCVNGRRTDGPSPRAATDVREQRWLRTAHRTHFAGLAREGSGGRGEGGGGEKGVGIGGAGGLHPWRCEPEEFTPLEV